MTSTTDPSASAGTSGNPFDDPAVTAQVSTNQPQQTSLVGSPRSVTTNANGHAGVSSSAPPPAMPPFGVSAAANAAAATPTAPPQPQPQPSVAAQNPFDDPEILRSVVGATGGGAAAAGTNVRPPLAGSMGGGHSIPPGGAIADPARRVRPGHRPSRTLCTSELSSVAARAAAGAAVNGAAPATFHSSAATTPTNASSPAHSNAHSTLSTPPSASPTVPSKETVQALAELAAALSSARPRANTAEEAQEEAAALARVTLGEYAVDSTGDKKSHAAKKKGHRRIGSGGVGGGVGAGIGGGAMDSNVAVSPGSSLTKKSGGGAGASHRRSGSMDKFKSLLTSSPSGKAPSPLTISPMRHRKSASLNTADMMDLVDSINEAGGGSRNHSIAHGKGAKIFGSMVGKMSPRGAGRGSIGGSSKGSEAGGGIPFAPSIAPASEGVGDDKLKDSSHSGGGGGMRDMYQARRKEAAAGRGNPFVSETSLLGTDFIPSVPDLGVMVGSLDDDDSIDTPSESDSVVDAAKTVGRREEVKGNDSSHSDNGYENMEAAVQFKRSSLTHLPPPSAVESETLPSMRSSEQEPAPHQVEIPPIGDFVLHAKLCNVLDEYRTVDQNFDFASLVGMDRKDMEEFVNGSGSGTTMLQESHRPIVSSIIECGDDVVVEGFVHEVGSCSHGDAQDDTGTARDKAPDDRVEAAIFYSAKNRQFIVAWRGPSHDQAKPVRNRHLKAAKDMLAHDPHSTNLSAEQAVPVFPAYRDSYFKIGIEEGVFALLDELADLTPFCDVVMTGYSFGSALATLAGARYASSRSQLRVCCSFFGSPKVGGAEFRHWANSLPNLKVMRVEYGSDPWVMAPEGAPWSHVGHSITIDSTVTDISEKDFKMESLHPKLGDHANKDAEEKKVPVIARAYRFDQHRPSASASQQILSKVAKSMTGGHHVATKSEKNDHELSAYVYAVERIASLNIPWISDFVGEDAGEGVVGKGGHDRRMFV